MIAFLILCYITYAVGNLSLIKVRNKANTEYYVTVISVQHPPPTYPQSVSSFSGSIFWNVLYNNNIQQMDPIRTRKSGITIEKYENIAVQS
jgi:hypothetical protein